MPMNKSTIRKYAEHIQRAYETRELMRPLSVTHPGITIEDAYSIQSAWVDLKISRGSRVVGHKIGLTSKAMQSTSLVNEPDYGALLGDSFFEDGVEIPASTYLSPRVEVELAFLMRSVLPLTEN